MPEVKKLFDENVLLIVFTPAARVYLVLRSGFGLQKAVWLAVSATTDTFFILVEK